VTANDLLDALRRVLADYTTSRDPAVVLALEPLDVAHRLAELVETSDDIRDVALAAIGQLHWYRALLLPAPDDERDLDQALRLFAQLSHAHVDLTPLPVRRLLRPQQDHSGTNLEVLRRLELCDDLFAEYQESQDPEVLRAAIAFLDNTRQAFSDADPRAAALAAELRHRLAVDRHDWYRQTGDASALDEAIVLARLSARLADLDHSARITHLSNLSLMLRDRYDSHGLVSDLDEATMVGRAAVALSAEKGLLVPAVAMNLSLSLLSRFRRDRRLDDLDEAVSLMRAAVGDAAPGHYRGQYLSNLAVALRARYDAVGRVSDLDQAVDAAREAVALTAPGDPAHSRCLSNLAGVLRVRSQITGNVDELDAAVETARRSVAATAPSDPDRSRYLSNLAMALRARYDVTVQEGSSAEALTAAGPKSAGQSIDLDEAIAAAAAAVDHTADDHPDRADRLTALASTLLQAGQRDTATALLREAAQHIVSRPAARVAAAQTWAQSAAEIGDFADALAGFTTAINLLPLLATREVTNRDRAFRLSGVLPGLTADAVASALHGGKPLLALELWEQGHGLLLDQELQLRSDLSHLDVAYPALASRLSDIRNALNALAPDAQFSNDSRALSGDIDQRMQLAHEWDEIVRQVRGLPGFEKFLRPPRAEELLAAGADGPVVLINVSQYRSDALLVTDNTVQIVRLANVTPGRVRAMTREFLTALSAGGDVSTHLWSILTWLWDAIAEPVLTHLGLADRNGSSESVRLWWCPAGDLVALPLHAAGHEESAERSVPNLVVSSYTPTLRALLEVRARPATALAGAKLLAVGMTQTPGAADLPETVREIEMLGERFPENIRSLIGNAATRASVLDAMAHNEVVHLACHGTTDLTDPSASGLLLADGRLTVSDILRRNLGPKELVVLSACETAFAGLSMSDEPVHLASALQLAGSRHVIGTLWPVVDAVAAQTAERFYAALDEYGRDGRHIARALSDAVRQVRDRYPHRPEFWLPYVHIGP